MFNYIIRRFLIAIPTLIGITLVTFFIINLAPGDPAQFQSQGIMDPEMSKRIHEELSKYYGLDKPIHERYVEWMGRLVTFDFGESMSADRRPVLDKIAERIWPTMSLAILSIGFSLLLAIPVGGRAAGERDRVFDTVSSTILYALSSGPG